MWVVRPHGVLTCETGPRTPNSHGRRRAPSQPHAGPRSGVPAPPGRPPGPPPRPALWAGALIPFAREEAAAPRWGVQTCGC